MNKERTQKILLVITKSSWGGAQKYVFELAEAFSKKDNYEITVISGGQGLLIDKLKDHNIKHIPLLTLKNDFNVFTAFKNIKELLEIFRNEKPNIIHLNSSKVSILGVIAGKIYSKAKIVFTSHGWPFNENRNFLVKSIIKIIMSFVVLMSDKIIAGSSAVKKQTPLYKIVHKKISEIYIGLTPYQLLSRENAREILNIKNDNKIHIVTNAELTKNKGYIYALGAIRKLVEARSPIHYHIIGDGKDKEKIKSEIKSLGLESFVTMHGFVNDARKYMSAFDIFLLTSITEAFGLVLTEALYAKLPTVATKVGGVSEIIIDEKTGLLAKSKNVNNIYEKLVTLLTNKELAKTLGENGYKKVISEFTFEKTVSETEEVYRPLVVSR